MSKAASVRERRAPRKIRFTAAEWASVADRARACGRAPARFVRETALGAVPRVRPTLLQADTIRVLARICARLRMLEREMPEGDIRRRGVVSAAVTAVLAEIERLDRRADSEAYS